MGRSPSRGETRQKKGPWTPDEDEILVSYIQKNGHRNWISLPRLAGLNRCGKSCRLRWTNYLRPDIKRGKFTQEEEQIILNLHSILGNKWSKIAAHLPGRTDNDVKNFWNTRLKRRLRQMGFDPLTHRRLTDIFSSLSYVIATANLKEHHLHNHHHHHHQPLDQYLQYLLQLSYSNAASSSSNPSFTADMDYYLSSNRNNISSQVFNNLISTPQMLNIGTTTTFENGNSSYNPSFPFSHMPELLQTPNSGCSFDQELTLNEDQTVNGNPNHHHGFFSLSSSTSSLPSVLAPPLTTGTFINYPADSAAPLPEVLLEGPLFHDTA